MTETARSRNGIPIRLPDERWIHLTKGYSAKDEAGSSYPQLLEFSNRISMERTCYGTYEFLDQSHGETIRKGCYWTTIPNNGTQMRIILTLDLQ